MNKQFLRFVLYSIIIYLAGGTLKIAIADENIGEPRTVRRNLLLTQ